MEININFFDLDLNAGINDMRRHSPCGNCSNNPMVNRFASGICNCALPYLVNPMITF